MPKGRRRKRKNESILHSTTSEWFACTPNEFTTSFFFSPRTHFILLVFVWGGGGGGGERGSCSLYLLSFLLPRLSSSLKWLNWSAMLCLVLLDSIEYALVCIHSMKHPLNIHSSFRCYFFMLVLSISFLFRFQCCCSCWLLFLDLHISFYLEWLKCSNRNGF